MADGKFISYLRVSTDKQGQSGLGLEAQREAITRHLNGGNWSVVREVVEVESGKNNARPALDEALRLCRLHRATLIVAKIDRLTRDAEFFLRLYRESSDNGVVFCDLPHIPEGPMGKFMLTVMAGNAELERGLISARTKAALKAAKARGQKLGGNRLDAEQLAAATAKGAKASVASRQATARVGAQQILPMIEELRKQGHTTLRALAAELNQRDVRTPRGGEWSAVQVQRVIVRATA
jgi:DNA invertase Pin-like site-specific DNA recombinase